MHAPGDSDIIILTIILSISDSDELQILWFKTDMEFLKDKIWMLFHEHRRFTIC